MVQYSYSALNSVKMAYERSLVCSNGISLHAYLIFEYNDKKVLKQGKMLRLFIRLRFTIVIDDKSPVNQVIW